MMPFEWSKAKNAELKKERGLGFEDVIFYILSGGILDIVPNPNQKKYPKQRMFIVNIDTYAYLVPFIETKEIIFLKTIIPSRKATKIYLKR
jgi:uncharacterized DUF497 family protein